jgi:hypothetical protein
MGLIVSCVLGGDVLCAERGMLYQKQRDYRKAVRELAKATELDPANAQVNSRCSCCSSAWLHEVSAVGCGCGWLV